MKRFWLSWYHTKDMGAFTLHTPWWISGHEVVQRLGSNPEITADTVVAAVCAEDEDAAIGTIIAAFDTKPKTMEWRFCEEKPDDWSPFSERFPKGEWMQWP